ncbi:hypothetical protein LMG29542_02351 [Paraburkholderia humisilvae]|uniref:Uncharacterized protein n=1 Tax=Paraburkholderia humisilvae TaxID=627669 RepID=A0A6J5DMK9_9BURK|nr:hypothetical protein LMG29542_02351 [Paraburkholderia humisilvae]
MRDPSLGELRAGEGAAELSLTREEALESTGRACKVPQPTGGFVYGFIVEVHPTGDFVRFRKGVSSRVGPQWVRREDVMLQPLDAEAGEQLRLRFESTSE